MCCFYICILFYYQKQSRKYLSPVLVFKKRDQETVKVHNVLLLKGALLRGTKYLLILSINPNPLEQGAGLYLNNFC
jgi:hypothetical protein